MCIIIAKPAGHVITEETIRNCWTRNPDGAGFCYPAQGQVVVSKGHMTLSSLLDALRAQTLKGRPVILHFRITTHGVSSPENTHPFQVRKNLAFAHNGCLFGSEWRHPTLSDTALLCRDILQNLPKNFHRNPAIRKLLANLSSSSKFAFLDSDGHIEIINRAAGVDEGGVWYSNTSYKTPQYEITYARTPKTGHGTKYPNYYDYDANMEESWFEYQRRKEANHARQEAHVRAACNIPEPARLILPDHDPEPRSLSSTVKGLVTRWTHAQTQPTPEETKKGL